MSAAAGRLKRSRILVKTCLNENNCKPNMFDGTQEDPILPIPDNTETKEKELPDSETEGNSLSILTIPSITDEEINIAIESISNNNNFELPDMFVVDCSITDLVSNQVREETVQTEEIEEDVTKMIDNGSKEIAESKEKTGIQVTIAESTKTNNDLPDQEEIIAEITESSNNFEDRDNIPIEQNTENLPGEQNNNNGKRPKRGRKRKFEDQNRTIRKKKANTNEAYISAQGKYVQSKIFQANGFQCKCPKKCTEKLSTDDLKAEFDKFWKAGCYEARCALLQGYVTECSKKRSYTVNSKRTFTRKYYVKGIEICKKTFLKMLGISQARIDTALMKNRNSDLIDDKRGVKSGGKNKISSCQLEEMRNFIDNLPKYKSHYCRNVTSSNYLAPNLNLPILYQKYKENTNNPVSFSRFRQCFLTDFNLKFKKPQKDTCLRCDTFKANITSANAEQKSLLNAQQQAHLQHAHSLREKMKSDLALAKSDPSTETLTFDLEKTHSLPKLPTSVVYYKRQLNLYNLGIHCGSNNKGYFHVWLEHQAGRGTQEVGSCIRKFVQENLKTGVSHLILWSDSCGGQNRSIKMVLFLQYILQNHPTLEKITLRFLQPGHTFLPNDSHFGDVECALKSHPRLYTDDDLIEIMRNCRRKNKFHVTKLTKDDFFAIEPILNQITNRKNDTQKNKISWLNTFEIQLLKGEPTMLYMKTKLSDEAKTVDIGKGGKGRKKKIDFGNDLPLLHPAGRELSTEKIKDLKEMLKLIPADAKPFYYFLKNVSSGNFSDDVDGFGSTIDFEIEDVTQDD